MQVRYHAFEPTASEPVLTKWNLDKPDSARWFIKETIDAKNRVAELAFFDRKGLFDGFTCFEPSIITFSYSRDKIVQRCWYANHKPMRADECDVSYKTIFHLNNHNEILWADRYYLIGDSDIVRKDTIFIKSIWYFYYSSAKMDGINPLAAPGINAEDETGLIPIKLK